MHFLDLKVEFLRPRRRRIILVAVCLLWSVVEFTGGAPFWGIIFSGLGVYALWQLFFDGWPEPQPHRVKADNHAGD